MKDTSSQDVPMSVHSVVDANVKQCHPEERFLTVT